ncbi:MAG: tryptophan--tRNA ligase [Deltaproteobacteria bacterium]|nr:tryptophan--tRNA ligase [Deltaproteobacteria bacterium]
MARVLTGIKPTGRLHLGNLEGAVRSWLGLMAEHELYCLVANWHAYTTVPATPRLAREAAEAIRQHTNDVAIDLIAVGLDPARATLFRQSDVKEHAELYLLLSMVTPVAWLTRVPTYKDLVASGKGAMASHGLLGYPVLQAADILLYRATIVPVGSDQLPHIELAREIARRFRHLYGEVFPEPEAKRGSSAVVPGIDGRKMSKSYDNAIYLADGPDVVAAKVRGAFTTPSKIHPTDPGVPEECSVCQLRRIYDPDGYSASWEADRRGERGCMQNKEELIEILEAVLAPIRRRRRELERDPAEVERVLADGAVRAREAARATIEDVRSAMRLT